MQSAQANAALLTEMQQNQTLALLILETATQVNRTSVAMLTKTIVELSTQVSTLTAKLATAHSENARMKKSKHRSAPDEQVHCACSNQTPPDQNLLRDRNVYSRSRHKFDPNIYCSSHAFMVEDSHNSATCRYPCNSQNKLATQLVTNLRKT